MKWLEELAARRRFGMRPGLAVISGLCHRLGDPQRQFPAVHVAGTNGKGAVVAMLDAALRAVHLRVGRYTSPHLVRLNERFFLDGAPIADSLLEAHAERVTAAAAAVGDEVTFFEALTAVAFSLYAAERVDLAVLECGLGGRLDATNVCSPELCVITRIGLDHCDWLGDTVAKIAAEKAGIVKPGVPIVLGANAAAVREAVESRARELGAPFYYAPDLATAAEVPDDFPLAGPFNRENAVTALAALKVLAAKRSLDFAAARAGLAATVWPGRCQWVGEVLVDGAHNPPAAQALAAALRRLPPHDLIAGFCGDKDVDEVLRLLAPGVRRAYAVQTNNPRSLSAAATAAKMRAAGLAAEPVASLREALARAGRPAVVCGSLFLAGEALVELGAYPWSHPRFDAAELLRGSAD